MIPPPLPVRPCGLPLCLAVVVFGLVSLSGCKPKPEPPTSHLQNGGPEAAPGLATDGRTASEILEAVRQRYRSATSYQDQGVLNLSYRLNGQTLAEPKRWSTQYSAAPARVAIQSFNSQIQANGLILGCQVFDIDTANLDNQKVLMAYQEKIPIKALLQDSIARHFLAGFSELPLDETREVTGPWMIPPPLALLTGDFECPWLTNPTTTERLADDVINGIPCFVIRSLADSMTSDIWVSQSQLSVVQMSLPLKLLAGEVITSTEVSDVVLLAKFDDAKFDQPMDASVFQFNPSENAKPVGKFVSLPEALPSELIGAVAPRFELKTPEGKTVNRLTFDGKTTALCWLAGPNSFPLVEQLAKITLPEGIPPNQIGLVYSELAMAQPGTGNIQPLPELKQLADRAGFPLYHDSQILASTRLKLKAIPAIVVFDGDSRIQFVVPMSGDQWPDDLKAALARIAKGENLATEMNDAYAGFLDTYHQQLLTVNADSLLLQLTGNSRPNPTLDTSGTWSGIRPVLKWQCDKFKQAGNILRIPSTVDTGVALAAFDGWQTIGLIGPDGNLVRKVPLPVQPDEALTQMILLGGSQRPRIGAFAKFGVRVQWLDQTWEPAGEYATGSPAKQIADVVRSDLNQDGAEEMLVAITNQGIQLVDPQSSQHQELSATPCDALVDLNDDILVLQDGQLKRLKAGTELSRSDLSFRRLARSESGQLLAVGVNPAGKWSAIGLATDLSRQWAFEIGPQLFENAIDPIASLVLPNGLEVWAIANSSNQIQLVTGQGKWMGDFQSTSPLSGLALSMHGGQVELIVANESGVGAWDLNLTDSGQ